MAIETPAGNIGFRAPAFSLRGVDGKLHTLDSARGPNGLLVMFICNHCPYVQKQIARIVSDCKALAAEGIGSIAIMSNDPTDYPEDSFENMKHFAAHHGFGFPYVIDEAQAVAKEYNAVCTPDFFGFNAELALQYRGRLDESWSGILTTPKRELLQAMQMIAKTGRGPALQNTSIGCSIKWSRVAEPT